MKQRPPSTYNTMRTEDGTRIEMGDVILFDDHGTEKLVYLRDYTMFSARIEMEDGSIRWTSRDNIKAI